MKHLIIYFALTTTIAIACNNDQQKQITIDLTKPMTDSINFKTGYSDVNGIKMYYEIYGHGDALVLIHGGGSTIQTSFGRIIPELAKYYTVIAMDLQNHGRSGFRDIPQTFEQDADDVAALLKDIGITKASFFGFSNGGTTSMQIAIRHPQIVNKLVLAAAAYKRDGLPPGFFDFMKQAELESMPPELKKAFLDLTPDSTKLQQMFERDRDRMIAFEDISDEKITSINAPTLIINGDRDVISAEHTVKMHRLIPNSRLAIIPGIHGQYIGEITTLSDSSKNNNFPILSIIKDFLDKRHD